MKTRTVTIFFIMILAVSTAQSDIVRTDIGTNQSPGWIPTADHLPSDLRHFLEGADEFTLYSLDPGQESKETNTFFHLAILGQIKIEQGAERTNLVTSLSDGIAEGGQMADCFNPRHGIRALKNGVAVDFVICFECGEIKAISSKGSNWDFPVSRKPAAIFNSVLKNAHVPLPSEKKGAKAFTFAPSF
ncbi:MAG TPA: hypothetical protein VMH87_00615 [Pseudomonadales bacterium]|nr:hypothetical protein [Pseudomonadales bacterium]